jgi:DNA-binding PadR family transcriptional regulator
MSGRNYLGEFEHIVVLALLRLADQAYGVTVRQEIEARTGREISIGAIYATLGRLEAKGYVNSYLGDPTPERGGRSKRFFRVTAKGVAAVNRTHRALQSMTKGLRLARDTHNDSSILLSATPNCRLAHRSVHSLPAGGIDSW